MNKNIYWSIAIKNIICVICFTALSIVFYKWWIVLFSALFMTSYEIKNRYYRICDKCGKHSPEADSYNEALNKAKAAGWVHYVEGNKDYCPECR